VRTKPRARTACAQSRAILVNAAVTNASNIIDTNNEQLPLDDNTQASSPHLQEPAVFTIEPFNHNTNAVNDDTVKRPSNQQEDVIIMHDITQS